MSNVVVSGKDYITINEFTFLRSSVYSVGVARAAPEGSQDSLVVCHLFISRPDGKTDKVSVRDNSVDLGKQATETVEIYLDVLSALYLLSPDSREKLREKLLHDLEFQE